MKLTELIEGANYCDKNFFKIACSECPYKGDCKKVEDLYTERVIVNGYPCGAFFLQDLNVKTIKKLRADGYLED